MKPKRTAAMATFPGREQSLLEMVRGITNQVDHLCVYANGYSVNGFMSLRRKIHYRKSRGCQLRMFRDVDEHGDIRDMGKFFPVIGHLLNMRKPVPGREHFMFFIDDDIIYPDDYCDRHMEFHRLYDEPVATTVHARRLKCFPITDYFRDSKTIHFRREWTVPTPVEIAGTGTVCVDVNRVLFSAGPEFKNYCGIGDVWFSTKMHTMGIPIICIPRTRFWLTDTQSARLSNAKTLYHESFPDTSRHVEKINQSLAHKKTM